MKTDLTERLASFKKDEEEELEEEKCKIKLPKLKQPALKI